MRILTAIVYASFLLQIAVPNTVARADIVPQGFKSGTGTLYIKTMYIHSNERTMVGFVSCESGKEKTSCRQVGSKVVYEVNDIQTVDTNDGYHLTIAILGDVILISVGAALIYSILMIDSFTAGPILATTRGVVQSLVLAMALASSSLAALFANINQSLYGLAQAAGVAIVITGLIAGVDKISGAINDSLGVLNAIHEKSESSSILEYILKDKSNYESQTHKNIEVKDISATLSELKSVLSRIKSL